MGVDYYKVLGVDRNASDDNLNKAYRKLAMKWQPDNYPNNKEEAEAKFRKISEAYKVLSDPQKKMIYDLYGEEGLKGQMPPPDARAATYLSTGNGPTTFRCNPRNADDIMGEFFGSSSPYNVTVSGGGGGGGSSFSTGIFGDDIFASFGGSKVRKAPPIENKLPCSLEELYKGTTKKLKISREIVDINGKTIQVEEILNVDVKPGWKKGTRITFPEKGNVRQNVIPADIIFIVDEKAHGVFTRDGNDLIVEQNISLGEALKGYTVQLTTLDGRSLNIPINSVIHPSYVETVPREGMPIQNEPGKTGNLTIKFNIKFPTRLTAEQKAGIRF